MGLISSFCTFICSDIFNQSTLDLKISDSSQRMLILDIGWASPIKVTNVLALKWRTMAARPVR